MDQDAVSARTELDSEREGLLSRFHDWLEKPMLVLSFVWLALFVVDVIWGLNPLLQYTSDVIWGLFVLEFAIGFLLAPNKLPYLKHNWLKAIALLAPALRLFRFVAIARAARAARAARGLRLLRVVSSVNRSMNALSASLGRRGFGYVVMLTFVVLLAGAAGMYAFESSSTGTRGLHNYAEALWWTAMVLTTMGSEYWPKTPEGRLLCLFLALYAFAMFGYVTATLATFFVGRDAANEASESAAQVAIDRMRDEVKKLRDEIHALSSKVGAKQVGLVAAGREPKATE